MIGWTAVLFSIQGWLSETPAQKATASTPAYLSVGMAFMSLAVVRTHQIFLLDEMMLTVAIGIHAALPTSPTRSHGRSDRHGRASCRTSIEQCIDHIKHLLSVSYSTTHLLYPFLKNASTASPICVHLNRILPNPGFPPPFLSNRSTSSTLSLAKCTYPSNPSLKNSFTAPF